MPTPVSQSAFSVDFVVGSTPVPGPWRGWAGGATTVESTRMNPGHEQPAITVTGPAQRENITIRRYYELDVIHEMYSWLEAQAADGILCGLTLMPHRAGKPTGQRFPRTGRMVSVAPPDYDTDSAEGAELVIECAIDGP